MEQAPCSCPTDQAPSQADLAQAVVELRAAALGKREFAAKARELRATETECYEELDLADRLDRVVDWLRAHYA